VYRSKRSDRVKILVWDTSGGPRFARLPSGGSLRDGADLEAIAAGIVPLAADHGRRDETLPVEFAALFDGLDWTRVQTIRGIPNPTVAV
jgi:transposase IS166 family protein/transposase IS66-like protein